MKIAWKSKYLIVILAFGLMEFFPVGAKAQPDLENRVKKLEKYVSSFQPTLSKFAQDMEGTMQIYTKNLEEGLNDYSDKLQSNLSTQINKKKNGTVVLDITSKAFQKIDTNVGTFLIYVDKISPIDDGFRLNLYIGNPYFANFKDFSINLVYGKKFPEGGVMSYDAWRSTLLETGYSFKGVLEKGKWNLIGVDISPASTKDIQYVECGLFISSVELDLAK